MLRYTYISSLVTQLSSVTGLCCVRSSAGGGGTTPSELILGLDFRGKGEGDLVCITYNKHQFLLASSPILPPLNHCLLRILEL
jgi:hypothetical protein